MASPPPTLTTQRACLGCQKVMRTAPPTTSTTKMAWPLNTTATATSKWNTTSPRKQAGACNLCSPAKTGNTFTTNWTTATRLFASSTQAAISTGKPTTTTSATPPSANLITRKLSIIYVYQDNTPMQKVATTTTSIVTMHLN